MDAFEFNKYNEDAYFKLMLSNSVIVSYGFISAIDLNTVEVTLIVTNKNFPDKINCTFMSLGNEQFALTFKPAINMRVVVFSPNKATNGMYETIEQIKQKEGKGYIKTGVPAVYSSQHSFCFPLMRSTSQALSSLLVANGVVTVEVAHDLVSSINGVVDLFISNDTTIEFNEGTKHTRNYEGDLIETFGMVEGIGGVEKSGAYTYEETYGKYSIVKKNFESGAQITVGKAYQKPFLENKGSLIDSSAPVTIELGTGAPVTLTFGDSAMTVTADTENGLDITLTGALKISLTADIGKFSIANTSGSLKDILDQIIDLVSGLTTIGGNVVVGAAYPAAADPATVATAIQLKTLVAGILE